MVASPLPGGFTKLIRRILGSGLARFVLGLGLGLALVGWLAGLTEAELGDRLSTFSTVFLGIFIEAAPFLLLGTIASGLVEVFVSPVLLRRLIPSGALGGALVGAALGFLFPVCECGTVPLTRRLFRKGLPVSVGVAFLLAAPVVNPIVLVSTAAAFGFGPLLAWRFALTAGIAIVTGLIFSVESRPQRLLRATAMPTLQGGSQALASAWPRRSWTQGLNRALLVAGDEFFEMGRYLVLGSALAAAMQSFIPQARLLGLGSGPLLSVLVMIGLAVLLSVCSTVDSFVALAFLGTFSPGSVLAFLVYGPMVDLKSVLMFRQVFKRRGLLYLVLIPFTLTTAVAVTMNLFLAP
jgi:uncharacterized membrane protein YraQ (UPF0718 family)